MSRNKKPAIKLKGKYYLVTEEVGKAYYRILWAEKKRIEREKAKERMIDGG